MRKLGPFQQSAVGLLLELPLITRVASTSDGLYPTISIYLNPSSSEQRPQPNPIIRYTVSLLTMPKDEEEFVPNPDQPVHQGKVSLLILNGGIDW